MRAVTVADGELRWDEHPDPVPGDGELLVSVRAAGVNAADLLQRRGLYAAPPGAPADIPGMEVAGEVVAAGRRVTRFAVGDRVMGLLGGGGQAELALLDEALSMAVPDTLTWDEAGGFPEVFCTAHDALFTQCALGAGERVLVTGAAGGVGTAAVQMAAVIGAVPVASVRSPGLRSAVEALGAATAVDPEEAPRRGPFDVALELVGGPGFAAVLASLALGGRAAVIGVGGGGRVELDLLALMQRRARVSGSTLRTRSLVHKALVVSAVEHHVLPLLDTRRVRVPVAATFALSSATDAYDRFAAGGKLGKVVLVADASA